MYSEYHDGATREYLSRFFDVNGYDAVESMENDGLLVRLQKDKGQHIIIAVNHSDTDKTLDIKLKESDPVSISVPPKDGKIVLV